MLAVPEHSSKAQQRHVSMPNTPTTTPGTVVDAATFVADQHPRSDQLILPVMAWPCSMHCACRVSWTPTMPFRCVFHTSACLPHVPHCLTCLRNRARF